MKHLYKYGYLSFQNLHIGNDVHVFDGALLVSTMAIYDL